MLKLFLLLSGGALGTAARYYLQGISYKVFDTTFPYGTLAVNLTGSFVIGLLWGISEYTTMTTEFRTFSFIGVLGGFTTFSSFTLETMNLFRDGETKFAIINILSNNLLGLILVFAGFFLSKLLINLFK